MVSTLVLTAAPAEVPLTLELARAFVAEFRAELFSCAFAEAVDEIDVEVDVLADAIAVVDVDVTPVCEDNKLDTAVASGVLLDTVPEGAFVVDVPLGLAPAVLT